MPQIVDIYMRKPKDDTKVARGFSTAILNFGFFLYLICIEFQKILDLLSRASRSHNRATLG